MKKTVKIMRLSALLLSVLLAASVLYVICYQYDNKYTTKGPQALAGVLLLDDEILKQYPVMFLVSDWEIYRGKLLTPDDFVTKQPRPDEFVFIGQYSGFEGYVNGQVKRSPHGSATYRLNISLPSEMKSYMLEVPEIYSAYKLYINGMLLAEMGETDPDSYRPQTGNRAVTVQAADRMEILIAVSDFSHFYSGMVYPPAFGEPESVSRLLNIRLGLRFLVSSIAFIVGILYLCIWLLIRKENNKSPESLLPLFYSALCLCYIVYTCYPIVKTLFPGGTGWYRFENLAYCAILLFVMLIQRLLSGANDRWFKPFVAFGIVVCCWSLAVPSIMGDSLNLMMTYSRLIGLYAWVSALFLTVNAAYGVYHDTVNSKMMLAGIAAFDAALIMDRLLPMFEPIRFGWFTEIAGGLLALLIGFVMAADVARQYRLRQEVQNRVESATRTLAIYRDVYYPDIKKSEEEARSLRHDLRHYITVFRQFVSDGNAGKLNAYLDNFEEKYVEPVQENYCEHFIANMLLRIHAGLARKQDTDFHVRASVPANTPIDDIYLSALLFNLLENALEASERIPREQRQISVSIGCELEMLGIVVTNAYNGDLKIKDGRFFSAKKAGRKGYGLESIRAICQKCGGSAEFYGDEAGLFHSKVTLPFAPEKKITSKDGEVIA